MKKSFLLFLLISFLFLLISCNKSNLIGSVWVYEWEATEDESINSLGTSFVFFPSENECKIIFSSDGLGTYAYNFSCKHKGDSIFLSVPEGKDYVAPVSLVIKERGILEFNMKATPEGGIESTNYRRLD